MEITGEQLIPLPQAEVWRGLNDPEVLKACIAGCESIERVSDTEYRVAMVAAVGPVKARFNGKLVLSDLKPPDSYSLSFEGSGGAAGFGKGGAQVSLKTEGAGTFQSGSGRSHEFPAVRFAPHRRGERAHRAHRVLAGAHHGAGELGQRHFPLRAFHCLERMARASVVSVRRGIPALLRIHAAA